MHQINAGSCSNTIIHQNSMIDISPFSKKILIENLYLWVECCYNSHSGEAFSAIDSKYIVVNIALDEQKFHIHNGS